MRSLIVGHGSIGSRHARHLTELGCPIALVSSTSVAHCDHYTSIKDALHRDHFDLVIIANPTHLHHDSLQQLIEYGHQGKVLVEKPLYGHIEADVSSTLAARICVGYNLRFSSLLMHVRNMLIDEEIISFSVHVGQYLPTWRQSIDYRESYSAKKMLGGGVLRDLSHELDYSVWLCGRPIEVCAMGGKFSELEIDSDDMYCVLMRSQFCPMVSIHLNYLDRESRRSIIIQTKKHTMAIDLIHGTLRVDGQLIKHAPNDMDNTYRRQLQAIITNTTDHGCSYEEGVNILKLIHAIEHANLSKTWVTL